MKNILIITGSGRPGGNTSQLVDAFTRGAEEAGHHVESVSLIKNKVNPCLGCNACRWGKPCVQKDDFEKIVPKLKEADLIVFASPLYYFSWSSRIQALIERFYCITQPDPDAKMGRYGKYPFKEGCSSALLMTAADGDFWTFEQAISRYHYTMISYLGFKDKGHVLAYGCGSCEEKPRIDQKYLNQAYEFGRTVYPSEV